MSRAGPFTGSITSPFGGIVSLDDLYNSNSSGGGVTATPGPAARPITAPTTGTPTVTPPEVTTPPVTVGQVGDQLSGALGGMFGGATGQMGDTLSSVFGGAGSVFKDLQRQLDQRNELPPVWDASRSNLIWPGSGSEVGGALGSQLKRLLGF